jgi:hypothetical protein
MNLPSSPCRYYIAGRATLSITAKIVHGVGVDHHGPSSNLPDHTVEAYQTGSRIYDSSKKAIE